MKEKISLMNVEIKLQGFFFLFNRALVLLWQMKLSINIQDLMQKVLKAVGGLWPWEFRGYMLLWDCFQV